MTALMALAAAWGNAQDWGNIAVISDTMGNNAGRLCIGEGLRVSDIGCPSYAPSVSTAGHVSVTGNLSASKFIGDGSLLTGINNASGDRIVSGTSPFTQMIAISDTRYISITQGGANTGWFDPTRGLVTLGVSASGGISGTTGYFWGPVGIGTAAPANLLHLNSGVTPAVAQLRVTSNGAGGLGLLNFAAGDNGVLLDADYSGGAFVARHSTASLVYKGPTGLSFYADAGLTPGNTFTPTVRATLVGATGNFGIGTQTPAATLQVSGSFTVSTTAQGANSPSLSVASNGSVGIGTSSSTLGAYPAMLHVMRPANYWGLVIDGDGSVQSDIIMRTRGNSADQRILQTVNNLNKVYVRSLSDAIAVRYNYWTADLATGALGISNTSPIAKLDVNGTISSSDAIQVGQSSLGCVNGISGSIRFNTTSDTLQVCTGSGWKSLVSGTVGVGTLTGTGIATAVAFWSGPSAVTYSDGFYWDNASKRLGIGTNTPAAGLEVSSTGNVIVRNNSTASGNVFAAVLVQNSSSYAQISKLGTNYVGYKTLAANDYGIFNSAGNISVLNDGGNINFAAGGVSVPQVMLTAGGNLGVGMITPTATLHVSGTISATNAIQVGTSSLACSSGIPGALRYNAGSMQYCNGTSWTTLGGGGTVTGTGSATAVAFWSGPSALTYSDGFYWDNAGKRLGVGTNVPGASVEVSSTEGLRLTRTGGANAPWISWYLNSIRQAYMGYGTPGTYFQLQMENGNNFYIGGGNVGINTHLPTATLQVSGSFTVSTSAQAAAQPSLHVGTNGNVGIGTSLPGSILTISQTQAWATQATVTNQSTAFPAEAAFQVDNGVYSAKITQYGSGTSFGVVPANATLIYSTAPAMTLMAGNASGYMNFSTGGASKERARLTAEGNLGIGTQSPTATLQVSGSLIVSTSAQSTTPSLYVGINGNVGIGTSGPATKLDVSGSIRTAIGSGGVITVFDATAANNRVIMGADASGGYLQGTYGAGGTGTLRFLNINTEGMRLSGGKLGISNTSPIAKLDVNGTISASDAIQVGTSALVCSSAISGSIRYATTSSTLEYCNSTAWTSLGPSDTQVVSFAVNKNGADQTVTAATPTKISFANEQFDTNNNFLHCTTNCNSGAQTVGQSRFTPTVRGKYLFTGSIQCSGGGDCNANIYKNGASIAQGLDTRSANSIVNIVAIVDMNGSSDYVELWGTANTVTTIGGIANNTYFQGALLGPQAGAAGAATSLSGLSDVTLGTPTNGEVLTFNGSAWVNSAGSSGDRIVSGTSNITAWEDRSLTITTAGTQRMIVGENGYVGIGNNTPSYTIDVTGVVRISSYGMFGTGLGSGSYIVGNGVYGFYRSNIANGYLAFPSNGVMSLMNANVGISTTTPLAKLDVVGTISASDAIQPGQSSLTCSTGIAGALRYNSGNLQYCNGSSWATLGASSAAGNTGSIQFNAAGGFGADDGWLHWDATNNRLGIGTATPSYPLDVYGLVYATGFVQSSDKRLKENITQIASGLAVISKLKPVTFDWKKDGKQAAGLIAQDVMHAIPSAVTSNTEGMFAVDYIQTIPYLVRGIQELKAANDNLTAANDNLAKDNKALTRDVKVLLDRLDRLEQRVNGMR